MKIKFSRLFVVIFALAIPIYIAYNFLTYDFQVSWLPLNWQESRIIQIIVAYITPILFCIAWIYVMISLATVISDSIDLMVEQSSFISEHHLFFFGVNTIVIFYIFLIPFITPIICMIAFASLIFKGLTSRVAYDDLDERTQKFVKRLTFFLILPVIFCSVLIVPESLEISLELWQEFWDKYVEELFYFIRALAVALSYGAAVLIYKKGVAEAEGRKREFEEKASGTLIFTEIVIVAFIVFLSYIEVALVEILYYLGPAFSTFTFIVNVTKGRKTQDYGNRLGLIVWLAFMITINLFRRFEFLRIWTIIISTILFCIYFIHYLVKD